MLPNEAEVFLGICLRSSLWIILPGILNYPKQLENVKLLTEC